jgi:hypothetical protein
MTRRGSNTRRGTIAPKGGEIENSPRFDSQTIVNRSRSKRVTHSVKHIHFELPLPERGPAGSGTPSMDSTAGTPRASHTGRIGRSTAGASGRNADFERNQAKLRNSKAARENAKIAETFITRFKQSTVGASGEQRGFSAALVQRDARSA